MNKIWMMIAALFLAVNVHASDSFTTCSNGEHQGTVTIIWQNAAVDGEVVMDNGAGTKTVMLRSEYGPDMPADYEISTPFSIRGATHFTRKIRSGRFAANRITVLVLVPPTCSTAHGIVLQADENAWFNFDVDGATGHLLPQKGTNLAGRTNASDVASKE